MCPRRLHAPPRGNTIGRGMKMNKEEILGMLVALENFLDRDHEADWQLWEAQVQDIAESVRSVPGVQTEIHVPEIANHVPSLRIRWDQAQVKIEPLGARRALIDGRPSIETAGGGNEIDITTWMMNPGEERIVAQRLTQVLQGAAT